MVSHKEYMEGVRNIPNNLKALNSAVQTLNAASGLNGLEGMSGISSDNLRQQILDRSGHIKPQGTSKA
jgi:hypothetical protein